MMNQEYDRNVPSDTKMTIIQYLMYKYLYQKSLDQGSNL